MARDIELDRLKTVQDAAYAAKQAAYKARKKTIARKKSASNAIDTASQEMQHAYDAQQVAWKRLQQLRDANRSQVTLAAAVELQAASDTYATLRDAFLLARARFDNAKREFDAAKIADEQAHIDFKTVRIRFDVAQRAFQSRLAVLKSETIARARDKRLIGERAGVPLQYKENFYVLKGNDGTIHVYFGGERLPNGPGHGHYILEPSGEVTHRREPEP